MKPLLHRLAHATSVTPNLHVRCRLQPAAFDVGASLTLLGGTAAATGPRPADRGGAPATRSQRHCPHRAGGTVAARAHRELVLDDRDGWVDWLDDLSLDCTDVEPTLLDELHALNIATVGDAPLARQALQQRFGNTLSEALAQAVGTQPTVLPYWTPANRFDAAVEFTDLARESKVTGCRGDAMLTDLSAHLSCARRRDTGI